MGKTVLTEQKKKAATQLYASGGMTISDIARQVGVSQSALSHWFNQQGWYTPRSRLRTARRKNSSAPEMAVTPREANKGVEENEFIIPCVLPGLNEFISAMNKSRYDGNKLKSNTEDIICSCINAAFGNASPFETIVQVHIHFFEKERRRDYDNIMAGQKFIMDALVKSGILYNDGQNFVMPCTFDFGVDADYPRVEVKVNPTEIPLAKAHIKETAVYKAKNNSLRYMSDGEMRQAYKLAANKKEQIKILAELNAMSKEEVKKIVIGGA